MMNVMADLGAASAKCVFCSLPSYGQHEGVVAQRNVCHSMIGRTGHAGGQNTRIRTSHVRRQQ